MEAWAYPLKLVDDFKLGFLLEGYPLEIDGPQIARWIDVRPEATTFTYSHAGFTVRQMIFAPVDEPAIVMLLDVQSVLPLTVVGSFRPRLKLMWPAGLMTGRRGLGREGAGLQHHRGDASASPRSSAARARATSR